MSRVETGVPLKNYCKVIVALLLWSSWGIAVQKLHIRALHTLFLTTLFSLPAVLICLFPRRDEIKDFIASIRGQASILALLAVCLLVNNYFYFAAFNRTSIAIAVFTHYTAPLFVAVLAPVLLHEHFDRRIIPPLLLALCGLTAILFPGFKFNLAAADLSGALCGVASGLAYALTLITAKHLTDKLAPLPMILGQNLFITLFLLPLLCFDPLVPMPGSAWLILLLLGIVLCALAPYLYLSGLRHIKAQHVATIGYLEPLAAVALGLIVSRKVPDLSIWLGGLAILGAGIMVTTLHQNTGSVKQ
ncbi:MAG: DMT family transporter [Deltaproteobacteria bacterium]|nr:DMT family transporter [Deltaproteobacteria bacterium]